MRDAVLSLVIILATLAACSNDVVVSAGSGGSTTSSAPQTGSESTAASGFCEAFSNCCDDVTGAEVEWYCQGEVPVCPDGASWPSSFDCEPAAGSECRSLEQCDASSYCDFPDDLCGAEQVGNCAPRPQVCDDFYDPVCGCDGAVTSNTCESATIGSDVSGAGGCVAPPGTFACGPRFCATESDYCQRQISDVANEPDSYGCASLPSACTNTPSCECVQAEPCGNSCELLPSGNVILTCPGG